jgi:hypothetical protein
MSFMPGNVYSPEMTAFAAQVAKREKRTEVEKLRRRCIWLSVLLGLFVFIDTLQAGSIRYMLPLKEIIPFILWRHDSGQIEIAVTNASLPIDMQDGALKQYLWDYTWYREMFTSPMMEYAHHVVDSMSTVQVADAYDKWIGAKANPDSYQNRYGPTKPGEADRCTVLIARDINNPSEQYIPPGPKGSKPGKYIFRYYQLINCRGEPPHKELPEYEVAIDFIAGYTGTLKILDVLTFNHSRIIVTGYSAPRLIVTDPSKGITH